MCDFSPSWDKNCGTWCSEINLLCKVLATFEAMAWICVSVCTLDLVAGETKHRIMEGHSHHPCPRAVVLIQPAFHPVPATFQSAVLDASCEIRYCLLLVIKEKYIVLGKSSVIVGNNIYSLILWGFFLSGAVFRLN